MSKEFFGGKARRKVALGAKLDRSTATLPVSTQTALFNITGGRVMLTSIIGEVTTVIETQACNLSLVSTPTTGTGVALCGVLDISADQVGCLYGITGTPATALVGANAGLAPIPTNWSVLPIGTLDWLTAATNSGSVKWSVTYIPYDDGGEMSVA